MMFLQFLLPLTSYNSNPIFNGFQLFLPKSTKYNSNIERQIFCCSSKPYVGQIEYKTHFIRLLQGKCTLKQVLNPIQGVILNETYTLRITRLSVIILQNFDFFVNFWQRYTFFGLMIQKASVKRLRGKP